MLDDDGEFLGAVMAPTIDAESRTMELGYVIAPHARGRGVASESLRLLTEWAFEQGAERLELLIATDNPASRRVAERCGYRLEGVMRSVYFKQGRARRHRALVEAPGRPLVRGDPAAAGVALEHGPGVVLVRRRRDDHGDGRAAAGDVVVEVAPEALGVGAAGLREVRVDEQQQVRELEQVRPAVGGGAPAPRSLSEPLDREHGGILRSMDEADQLVRRLAAAVEEDEQIAPSLCHAVFLEHLQGPLADALVPHLQRAVGQGAPAQPLLAAYWRIVDASLVPLADEVSDADLAEGLERLEHDAEPGGPPALDVLTRAHAWRRECAAS